MKKKAYRPMYRFWLNWSKPEEKAIADIVVTLKEGSLFTKTIRDGICLICNLREGKLDVLFELFPWVQAEFFKYMEQVQQSPPVDSSTLSPDVEKYLQEILDKLDKPQAMPGLQAVTSVEGKPKQLAVPEFGVPDFDLDDEDDDFLSVVADTRKVDTAQNFITSLMSLG